MQEIIEINTIELTDWSELIQNSSTASYFQSPEGYDFFTSLSFLDTFVYGVKEGKQLKGVVSGYIVAEKGLKRYFSRRAIIHGGVLMADDITDEALERLLSHVIKELSKRSIYIETRNYFDYSAKKHIFEKVGFKYQPHLNFRISTNSVDEAFARLTSTKRRDVRITIKNGVEIINKPSDKELKDYYSILYDLYHNKIKLPLFPFEFFEKLSKIDKSKLFIMRYNGKVIGGSVCIGNNDGALYELFVCGMDKVFKNVYPSVLSTWAAIEHAANNGYRYFDMMGAGKPNDGYGVRDFKSKFGGELVEYGRYIYVCNKVLWRIATLGLRIIKSIKSVRFSKKERQT